MPLVHWNQIGINSPGGPTLIHPSQCFRDGILRVDTQDPPTAAVIPAIHSLGPETEIDLTCQQIRAKPVMITKHLKYQEVGPLKAKTNLFRLAWAFKGPLGVTRLARDQFNIRMGPVEDLNCP